MLQHYMYNFLSKHYSKMSQSFFKLRFSKIWLQYCQFTWSNCLDVTLLRKSEHLSSHTFDWNWALLNFFCKQAPTPQLEIRRWTRRDPSGRIIVNPGISSSSKSRALAHGTVCVDAHSPPHHRPSPLKMRVTMRHDAILLTASFFPRRLEL